MTKSFLLAPGQWKMIDGIKIENATSTMRRVYCRGSGINDGIVVTILVEGKNNDETPQER